MSEQHLTAVLSSAKLLVVNSMFDVMVETHSDYPQVLIQTADYDDQSTEVNSSIHTLVFTRQ